MMMLPVPFHCNHASSMNRFVAVAAFLIAAQAHAQSRFSAGVRQFIVVDTPVVAITNVRVIDGTGAAPMERQIVLIRDGKITAIGTSASVTPPASARVIDGTGKTLIPGLVLVHEHLFYPSGERATYHAFPYSFARMYLAAGITTARTGGNMGAYADLNIKRQIDAGTAIGPKLDVTAPYLNGTNPFPQMYSFRDSADARRFVAHWADLGATSFKAYMQITRDQLRAAVDEAHRRGLKVTGHLCSVTYREAATLGIDNLEHGFLAATDFSPRKQPDACPGAPTQAIAAMDVATDTIARSVIRTLVDRGVAVTSTLAIFESFTPGTPEPRQAVLDAMSSDARESFLTSRARATSNPNSPWVKAFENGKKLEKMFVDAGGLLVAGTDPTGFGGVLPGYGSLRQVELLVDAGFTPVQAIRIASLNGATYLGRNDRVGSIAVGKDADLVLIDGNPAANIADIWKPSIVFKDGVGFDSAKLFASVKGAVGAQ